MIELSKTLFIDGASCLRCLYLDVYKPELADPITPETLARFDTGKRVGLLAQRRYSDGVLVNEDNRRHEEAVEHTKNLIIEGVPTIFEAAFTYDNVKIRADILEHQDDDRYAIKEVKFTGAYDAKKHLADVAVQVYVLRGVGLDVTEVELMHLDKEYIYQGGEYDVDKLFAVTSVRDDAGSFIPAIPDGIKTMIKVLSDSEIPPKPTDVDCTKPYQCRFKSYCHADDPVYHITELPSSARNTKLRKELDSRGINNLLELPEDIVAKLNHEQELTWRATVEGRCIIAPDAGLHLRQLRFPIHFIDFETVNPALPLFVGTRPFQFIPFQWSDHILDEDGKIRHCEFLGNSLNDPSREFASSLLNALSGAGSIVHYTPFEKTQIKLLAQRIPELAPALNALEPLLFDLAEIIKKHCFDPRLHGRYSIKYALPVFAQTLPNYDELEVQNGDMVMRVYAEMLDSNTDEGRRAQIDESLRVYCQQDTLGMLEIYKTLSSSVQ